MSICGYFLGHNPSTLKGVLSFFLSGEKQQEESNLIDSQLQWTQSRKTFTTEIIKIWDQI